MLKGEIKRAVRIAEELQYPKNVIKQLKKAESSNEIERILRNARLSCDDYYSSQTKRKAGT